MRFRRCLLYLGLGSIALIVVLLVAAWLTARSAWAAQQVAAQIAEAAGAPVRVGGLQVGVTGTSLRNLQFLEEGAPEGTPPWAVVPEVNANLSLAKLLRGDLAGGTVTLRNAQVILRLDREDRVLTKLPSPEGAGRAWPAFRLEGGQITLQREGRPDTVFRGLGAEIRKDGDRIAVTGRVDDPEWGQWTLGGGRNSADAPYDLALHTDRLHVTPDKTRRVPFVPPAVWEQVQFAGDTAADLALSFGGSSSGPDVRYRVEFAPRDIAVQIRSVDLTVQATAGRARVEDGVVTLVGVRGRAAGGELHTDATMDFRAEGSEFKFDVAAQGLVLQQLPASWGLPRLDGRMSGKADLQATVRDGNVQTRGQGQGTIDGFLGKTLQVRMLATERGYRFDISDMQGAPINRVAVDTSALARLLALAAISVQPPAQPRAAPAANQPLQDLELNFGLHDVDLAELIRRLDVKLPFALEGKLTFQVKAAVPLRDVNDLKAYRFNGTVSLPWAKLEGLEFQEVRARVVYEQGVARLEELSASIPSGQPNGPPGTIAGTAQVGVVPAGELTAQLTVRTLPIGPLLAAIPNVQAGAGGTADGEARLRAPTEALRDVRRWEANARLTAKQVQAFGRSAEELAVQAQLRDGTVSVSEARGRLNGASVTGTGKLELDGQYAYSAHVELPPSELSPWQQVIPELRSVRLAGKARTTADARGTLHPLTVQASGDAEVEGLALNDFRVGTLRVRWDANTDRVRLSDFTANLYGGELTGTAEVPLKPNVAGRVELKLSRLDTGNLTKDVPSPVRLEGAAQGSVTINLPPAPAGREREITADVQLQAERLRIQNIPADRLQANVIYRNGVAGYKVEGEALGGKFELSGRYPQQQPALPPADERGSLSLRNIDLSRFADAFRSEALRPLSGRLNLDAEFRPTGPRGEPTGGGQLTIDGLSWNRRTFIDRLGGEVRLGGGALSIPELTGHLAGGTFRARLSYNYRDPERSDAALTLERVDAKTLLAPFTDAPPIDGPIDVRLFTRLGREWSGTGQVLLPRGRLLGIRVSDARFPLGWNFAPGSHGELRLRDGTAQASRGRLTARATLIWGYETNLDGEADFSALDISEFLNQYSETSVASGLASGRVHFGGRNLRSANDLTANVEARLAQTTAFQVPVLRQISPFILPGVGANALFNSGDVLGHLAGGVFRIEQLSLVGDLARVFVEGTVTLQQRLNLDVVANTAQMGIDPSLLQILNLSLPAIGPIPLSLINQASNTLANRTIRLRVSGTIRAPSIQINPVALLSEAAVRFFLGRTGLPIPTQLPVGMLGG